eukprot:TRINITY_DN66490_c3_g8_i1.p1 TRINITY_DN66490_c3_g8~~TRINITY_DN66490_c3_g8_i1.p1  ORF type:complete len:1068 (-),score=605.24 TRINITY_DN66490_c3_g8_i1:683-3847(-)
MSNVSDPMQQQQQQLQPAMLHHPGVDRERAREQMPLHSPEVTELDANDTEASGRMRRHLSIKVAAGIFQKNDTTIILDEEAKNASLGQSSQPALADGAQCLVVAPQILYPSHEFMHYKFGHDTRLLIFSDTLGDAPRPPPRRDARMGRVSDTNPNEADASENLSPSGKGRRFKRGGAVSRRNSRSEQKMSPSHQRGDTSDNDNNGDDGADDDDEPTQQLQQARQKQLQQKQQRNLMQQQQQQQQMQEQKQQQQQQQSSSVSRGGRASNNNNSSNGGSVHRATVAQRRIGEMTRQASEREREKQVLDDRQSRLGREFMIYLLFLIVFSVATTLARGDQRQFYMREGMVRNALERQFNPDEVTEMQAGEKDFFDVATISDFWIFLQKPLIHFLLAEKKVNLDPRDLDNLAFPNEYNKLLGAIRLRQLRVGPNSCEVPGRYQSAFKRCFAPYSDEARESRPFGPASDPTRYKWQSAESTGEPDWYGKLQLYPGSGYVVDLPLDLTNATKKLEQLFNDSWIDLSTRLVLVDYQTYNPAVNLHFMGRLAFEMPASGGVRPKADFYSVKMNRYFGAAGQAQLVFEIFVLIGLVWYIVEECLELKHEGFQLYWRSGWNYLDWFNIVLFIITIGVRARSIHLFDTTNAVLKREYVSLQPNRLLIAGENLLSSINAFLLWVKVFKYFSFSKRVKFLFRTFQHASADLFFFTILFVCVFLGFAQAGYLAFSGDVDDFRSLGVSFVTLFRSIVGEMDYQALSDSNRIYGPLYFITFQVTILLILVNVFLAIITDAYSIVREENENDAEAAKELNVFRSALKSIKSVFSVKRLTKAGQEKARQLVESLRSADMDSDNKVSRDELIATFMEAGASKAAAEEEADALLLMFDQNKDGQLDKAELEAIQQRIGSRRQHYIEQSQMESINKSVAQDEQTDEQKQQQQPDEEKKTQANDRNSDNSRWSNTHTRDTSESLLYLARGRPSVHFTSKSALQGAGGGGGGGGGLSEDGGVVDVQADGSNLRVRSRQAIRTIARRLVTVEASINVVNDRLEHIEEMLTLLVNSKEE